MVQLDTYSLCTKWFLRSCVMSSCQIFLIPDDDGGPAVGIEPTPLESFIRLGEKGGNYLMIYFLKTLMWKCIDSGPEVHHHHMVETRTSHL